MHLLSLCRVLGALLIVLGGSQLVPMAVALVYREPEWVVFLYSAAAVAATGVLMYLVSRHAKEITERDGFYVVTAGWICSALVGAIPYYFTGTLPAFTDAVFESMSGFTTTGASVFERYDTVSNGIFLWRSMTQWFGGMGIIVLALVILPALGIGGMELFKREVPGPYSEKITPRIRDTAKALWSVYLLFTVLATLVLYGLGMTLFEAVNHALTTISTAGFSTNSGSVGGFESPAIEWVIIFFMFLSGMNFSHHYSFLTRKGRRWNFLRETEWRWYTTAMVVCALAVIAYLYLHQGYSLDQAATKGSFQVVSILTTTGYSSDDYVQWGAFPQILLFILMITGGCAGSTSGGVKFVRVLLIFKFIRLELLKLLHPKVVVHVKINRVRVTPEIQSNIFAFLFLYITTLAVATLLVSLDGHSFLTSVGAAVSALSNIGPGLDAVGPAENFAGMSSYLKWVLIACMMMGRLELMTVFVLFMPRAWLR